MTEVAEELYAALVQGLMGDLEAKMGAFLQLFQARHGRILKRTAFAEGADGTRRYALRGEKVEGILGFTPRNSPDRLIVIYEGTLIHQKEAVTRTSLMAMGPGFGPYEAVTVFAVDGWIHNQQRRYGITGGRIVDVDARKRAEREGFSDLGKSLLALVDAYQYDRAIDLLDRHRRTLPDGELVRIYRDVAEQTHHDMTLPSMKVADIVNQTMANLRAHQGLAVVVNPDGRVM